MKLILCVILGVIIYKIITQLIFGVWINQVSKNYQDENRRNDNRNI